jgi:hypothetical protein
VTGEQILSVLLVVWLSVALVLAMWWSFEEGRGNYYGDRYTVLLWPLAVVLIVTVLPFEGMEALGRAYQRRRDRIEAAKLTNREPPP